MRGHKESRKLSFHDRDQGFGLKSCHTERDIVHKAFRDSKTQMGRSENRVFALSRKFVLQGHSGNTKSHLVLRNLPSNSQIGDLDHTPGALATRNP